jgi:succinyl-CoA synthetase alpha subunit
VPPPFAADAILEGVDADLDLVVAITEGIPIRDMVRVKRAMQGKRTRLVGPTAPASSPRAPAPKAPRAAAASASPGYINKQGHVGVVSRSGTLTYEAVFQLTSKGIGQSTTVGIGGDPVNGTSHLDVIKLFAADPETHGIILIGEIGGNAEVEAARWIKANCKKPVAGFIAGATAPAGRRMGHAGAIVGGAEDTAAAKIAVFKECGIEVAATPSDMADALLRAAKAKPELQWMLHEVHPEVSFAFWNAAKPMSHGKKTPEGRTEREQLIDARWPEARSRLQTGLHGKCYSHDDLNDAFAALWSAERINEGTAVSFPDPPVLDRTGIPMVIRA